MSEPLRSSDLHGVIVPLVTPFTADGAVDEPSFLALADWIVSQGVHGLVLNGTTGESPTVRWTEVERLVTRLRATVAGRVPILVGTGTYDTAESVERTERARALGADGAFAVVPYYSRPAPAGVVEHFRRIAAVGLPTVAYHIPYRTGLTLDLPTLRALLALPGVIGMKESSGSVANIRALAGSGALLCGEDALYLEALEAGARGGIVAAANLVPRAFVDAHRAFIGGRPLAARAAFGRIRPLVDALFAEPNPAPLKWALAREGRIASPALRLPCVPISEPLERRLAGLLQPPPHPPAQRSDEQIDDLARRFAAQQVPHQEWTHTAHLLTGAWHVHHFGPDEALARMREGIRRLNQSHGTPETPTRGYHETITRAYVELLAIFLASFPEPTPLATRAAALLAHPLSARNALLAFYRAERLMSPAARAAWEEPEVPLHPQALAVDRTAKGGGVG
jgi:4-hydroxy-tetrahydrodipicolinate synthase